MTELGITGIVDSFVSFDDVKVYQELWANNELTVRTKLLLSLVPFTPQQIPASPEQISLGPAGLSAQVGLPPKDDMLRIDGLKTIADGGIEGAFMRKPYLIIPEQQEDPSYVGKLILSRDVFKAQCMRAAQNDWRLGCHVVGDAGMDHLLDVWEEVNRETPIVDLHWSIIHAFMPGQNFERIKRLGAYVTCQHAHTYTMGDSMVKWWGAERANSSNPVKEYMAALWSGTEPMRL